MQQHKNDAHHQPPAGTHEFLVNAHRNDDRTTRIGLSIAVLAHLVFFAVNWPSIASSTPEPAVKKPRILVLRNIRYEEPPPPPEPEQRYVRPTYVPVPDPTPEEPEVLRDVAPVPANIDWDSLADPDDRALPAPPPPQPPTVVRVHVDVEPPRKIHSVDPVYTEAARHAGIEGAVILKLIIGADGRVQSIDVLRGLHLGLTEAAVTAARQWVFEPSTYNSRATAVEYILTVRFSLSR